MEKQVENPLNKWKMYVEVLSVTLGEIEALCPPIIEAVYFRGIELSIHSIKSTGHAVIVINLQENVLILFRSDVCIYISL